MDHVTGEIFEIWSCNSCGLRWIANPPSEDELDRYYATDVGQAMRERSANLFARLRMIRMRREAGYIIKNLDASRSILDFGSGDGAMAVAISEHGFLVEARDMYPECDWTHGNISYRQIRPGQLKIEDLLIKSEVPEQVIMRHVLEHAPDPAGLLQVLRQANVNILHITVPNIESRFSGIFSKNWYFWDPPRHLFYFSPKTIELLAEKNGFRVTELRQTGIDEVFSSLHRWLRVRRFEGHRAFPFERTLLRLTYPTSLLAGLSSAVSGIISKGVLNVRLERR